MRPYPQPMEVAELISNRCIVKYEEMLKTISTISEYEDRDVGHSPPIIRCQFCCTCRYGKFHFSRRSSSWVHGFKNYDFALLIYNKNKEASIEHHGSCECQKQCVKEVHRNIQ